MIEVVWGASVNQNLLTKLTKFKAGKIKRKEPEVVTVEDFCELAKMTPLLLQPVFETQRRLRVATLGLSRWNYLARKPRKIVTDPSRMEIMLNLLNSHDEKGVMLCKPFDDESLLSVESNTVTSTGLVGAGVGNRHKMRRKQSIIRTGKIDKSIIRHMSEMVKSEQFTKITTPHVVIAVSRSQMATNASALAAEHTVGQKGFTDRVTPEQKWLSNPVGSIGSSSTAVYNRIIDKIVVAVGDR